MTSPQHPARSTPRFGGPIGEMDRRDLSLLPLRLFLGVTYIYAGLQKLADPAYFDTHAAGGVKAQMDAAAGNSPIGGSITTASHHAVLFGAAIALGELAVGLGILLGLWTRVAAIGGVLLSLSFLLTVSWHSHPYFLGPDSIYLMAFVPFVIAGSGPWTIDAYVADGLGAGRHLRGVDIERRRFLDTARIALYVGGIGALGAGVATAFGRLGPRPADTTVALGGLGGTTTTGVTITTTGPGADAATTTAPTTTTSISGTSIGNSSAVPVGGAARFRDPATGTAAIVVQPTAGVFEACSAVCTHEGCAVTYDGSSGILVCPCHRAMFDPKTGAVLQGPAQQPLALISIRRGGDGTLYVGA